MKIQDLLKNRASSKLVWYEYQEVLPNDGIHVQNTATVDVCLELQRKSYRENCLVVSDDTTALNDFILTNWAAEYESPDEP